MSVLSPSGLIDPSKKYILHSDFFLKSHGRNSNTGDVFVITGRNVPWDRVIDFSKVPYTSGRVYLCEESQSRYDTVFSHNGVDYQAWASDPFNKGAYAGRVYELARKVAYVDRHLRDGQLPLGGRDGIAFSHEGDAFIRGRCLGRLNLDRIEKEYQETRARVEPCAYYSEQVLRVSLIVGVVASAWMCFSYRSV